jgi:hypothetical protein
MAISGSREPIKNLDANIKMITNSDIDYKYDEFHNALIIPLAIFDS